MGVVGNEFSGSAPPAPSRRSTARAPSAAPTRPSPAASRRTRAAPGQRAVVTVRVLTLGQRGALGELFDVARRVVALGDAHRAEAELFLRSNAINPGLQLEGFESFQEA